MTRVPTRVAIGIVVATAIAGCAHASAPAAAGPLPRAEATASSACRRQAPACGGAPIDYERDVHPILAARCFKCHTGEGVAADEHDFSQADHVRAQHVALANEVSTCSMPPAGELLPEGEARVLLAWAACGAN